MLLFKARSYLLRVPNSEYNIPSIVLVEKLANTGYPLRILLFAILKPFMAD